MAVAVLVIVGFSLYAAREIRTLRDEQAAMSERNRLDTLQIVRIQQNLASVGGALRDMLGGTEPYPLAAWANTFTRLRVDLEQALARERELVPAGRLTAEQARLDEANGRFWEAVDRAFATANANGGGPAAESAAAAIIRGEASARHAELVTLVSQLVIHNTRMDEASAARGRDVYDRVARQIYLLAAVLVAGVVIGGAILLRNTRRTFDTVHGLAAERRALSWRMLTMQETLQTEFARELHDEFGQILTAVGMMLGRVRRKAAAPSEAAAMAPFIADLEEAQQVTQRTLDRVRKKSRLLHPVILDDFGLQQAVAWYTDEFARQHGIDTRFEPDGDLAGLPADVATHLYRIVQESLTNVARHAEASQVDVRLVRDADGLELSVADDGKGPPSLTPPRGANDGPGGIGMTSMRERAALMGGRFEAGRGPRGGLHVVVWVPLARPAAAAARVPSWAPTPARSDAPIRPRKEYADSWLKGTMAEKSGIRVVLSDDHALVRQGFRRILEDEPDITVVAEGGNGAQAVELARSHKPDVVVLDMAMPDMNGVQAARMILRERPQTRVLILSMYADEQYVRSALDAGVAGYILKNALDNDLTRAVRAVAAGQQYLSPELSAIVIKALQGKGESDDPWDQLTEREKQVLQLIAHGKSNKEIAVLLGLSVNTVAVHRANLMSTLKVHKAAELVLYAVKKGLVVTG